MAFGMGKNYRFFHVNTICASLGESQSKALPVFHAFSGLDTNSAFNGKGKKSVWQAWQINDVTETFVSLASNPFQLLNLYDEHFEKLERLTVILYEKTSPLSYANEARRDCFARRIEQWTNCHPPRMCYSNLSEAGIRTISAQTHLINSCTELIKCSCKGDCSNCTCGKANPDCSPLCKCKCTP